MRSPRKRAKAGDKPRSLVNPDNSKPTCMDFIAHEENANFIRPAACFVGRVVKVDFGSLGTFSTMYSYVEEGSREVSVMVEVWSVEEGRGAGLVVSHGDDDNVVMSRYFTVNSLDEGDLTLQCSVVDCW